MRRLVFLLMASLFVAAPVWAIPWPSSSPLPQSGTTPDPMPRSIWAIDGDGVAVNPQSALRCEPYVGGFKRVHLTAYQPNGMDVSCTYLNASGSLITLYLWRRPARQIVDDFEQGKSELTKVTPGALPLSDAEQRRFKSNLTFYSLIYSQKGGAEHTGLWDADLSGWTLQFRATYALSDEQTVLDGMSALTASVEKSAGAHLSLCAKSAGLVRDGLEMGPQEESIALANLDMNILLGRGAKNAWASHANTWCVENALSNGRLIHLLWHAVDDNGGDMKEDRLTAMTMQEAPTLASMPNPFLNPDAGKNGRERWAVTIEDRGKIWLFDLYAGRPRADDLDALLRRIESGKTEPLAFIAENGKVISLIRQAMPSINHNSGTTTAAGGSQEPPSREAQICEQALGGAKKIGVVPYYANLSGGNFWQTDASGAYTCAAQTASTKYRITVTLLCSNLLDQACVQLSRIVMDDGTVLYHS
jgi:hypothetical protein